MPPTPGCLDGISSATPEVLLWDFGDTLVDERWMLQARDTCTTWAVAWADVMSAAPMTGTGVRPAGRRSSQPSPSEPG